MLHEVAGTAHNLLLHAGHLSPAAICVMFTATLQLKAYLLAAYKTSNPMSCLKSKMDECGGQERGVGARGDVEQAAKIGAYLHECARIHQARQLTHDGDMLASIPLGSTELTEILHKVLQH